MTHPALRPNLFSYVRAGIGMLVSLGIIVAFVLSIGLLAGIIFGLI